MTGCLLGLKIGVWDAELPDGDFNRRRLYCVNVWEQLGYDGALAGREVTPKAPKGSRINRIAPFGRS